MKTILSAKENVTNFYFIFFNYSIVALDVSDTLTVNLITFHDGPWNNNITVMMYIIILADRLNNFIFKCKGRIL
jgi:hypothetical protein